MSNTTQLGTIAEQLRYRSRQFHLSNENETADKEKRRYESIIKQCEAAADRGHGSFKLAWVSEKIVERLKSEAGVGITYTTGHGDECNCYRTDDNHCTNYTVIQWSKNE